MAEANYINDATLSEKWRKRFAFFDAFGGPSSPQYKTELKKLPFRQKILINGNFIAFFFGPIYFFILGLWKKALVLLGAEILLSVVLAVCHAPDALYRGLGMGFSVFYMLCANYSYYLKKMKAQDGWNPFEGMRL